MIEGEDPRRIPSSIGDPVASDVHQAWPSKFQIYLGIPRPYEWRLPLISMSSRKLGRRRSSQMKVPIEDVSCRASFDLGAPVKNSGFGSAIEQYLFSILSLASGCVLIFFFCFSFRRQASISPPYSENQFRRSEFKVIAIYFNQPC